MNRGSGSVAPCAHSDAAGLQATLEAHGNPVGVGHELSEPDTAHPTVMLEVLASCGGCWVRRHPAGLYSSTERQSADRMLIIGYSWASAPSPSR